MKIRGKTMRPFIALLASVAAGVTSFAFANPPAAAPAAQSTNVTPQAASTPASATPSATTATPDTKPAVVVTSTPEQDALEKHFLAEGYKEVMHNGEKMFCRQEEQLGSRLGGRKVCGTAQQLMVTEQQAQASVDRNTMQQNNPTGK
jgi:hypothetical protein